MAHFATNHFSLLDGDDDSSWQSAKKKNKKKNNKSNAADAADAAVVAPAATPVKAAEPVVHDVPSSSSMNGNGFVQVTKKGGHGNANGRERPQASAAIAPSNTNAPSRTRANILDDAVTVAEELARTTTDESGRVQLWRDWARHVRVVTFPALLSSFHLVFSLRIRFRKKTHKLSLTRSTNASKLRPSADP